MIIIKFCFNKVSGSDIIIIWNQFITVKAVYLYKWKTEWLTLIIKIRQHAYRIQVTWWDSKKLKRFSIFKTATSARSPYVKGRNTFSKRQLNYQCSVIKRFSCLFMIKIRGECRTTRATMTFNLSICSTIATSVSFCRITIMTKLAVVLTISTISILYLPKIGKI